MADVHSKKVRSFNMSQIRAINTKPELLVRKYLHPKGFRFQLHQKKITGKPDLYLKKLNTAIFIHGCFWHGHKHCKYFVVPKTNVSFWKSKINSNKERDKLVKRNLRKQGIRIIEIWECQLKPKKRERTLLRLEEKLLRDQKIFRNKKVRT